MKTAPFNFFSLYRDVEFSLIGFGGSGHTGPLHYPNNGKLKYEGKTDKITFKTAEAAKPNLEFWEEKFNMIVDFVTTELGKNL